MDEQSEQLSSQDKENLSGEVMDSIGVSPESAEVLNESPAESAEDMPKYAKEKIGKLQKRYSRDMRRMQQEMAQLKQRSYQGQPQQQPIYQDQVNNTYLNNQGVQQPSQPMGIEDHIHRAVNAALQAREQQEQQAKNAEKAQYINSQYERLQQQLDSGASKYDDFDDVVRANDAPITAAMRDAALLFPHDNADEVFYKLAKNRNELSRISALPEIDQARELVKLSVALASGNNGKQVQAPQPIGQIKSNPVANRGAVTDRTPISELRQRMKAGWK